MANESGNNPRPASLEALGMVISNVLDDLQKALGDAKRAGCDLQLMVDAIEDIPIPAVRIFRDGHEVWCGVEHLAVAGL